MSSNIPTKALIQKEIKNVFVVYDDESSQPDAEKFVQEHGIGKVIALPERFQIDDYYLHYSASGAYLSWTENGKKSIRLQLDFADGANAHRRHYGGGKGQAIAKAVGVQPKFKPTVLDCTAGQGGDAFVLATLGCRVSMVERSPIAFALLDSALKRAYGIALDADSALLEILERLSLTHEHALSFMGALSEPADVVYLDPMFPERKKSAAVKKEMRVFHDLIGTDDDAGALLDAAINASRYRTVVKRSKLAPFLDDKEPTFQMKGKSTRYDIYVNKALPS